MIDQQGDVEQYNVALMIVAVLVNSAIKNEARRFTLTKRLLELVAVSSRSRGYILTSPGATLQEDFEEDEED